MAKEIKHTGSFVAEDDEGIEYRIDIFSEFNIVRSRGGGTQRIPGLKSLQLQDGRHVNRIKQGQYEIVDVSMTKLTSTDPFAP